LIFSGSPRLTLCDLTSQGSCDSNDSLTNPEKTFLTSISISHPALDHYSELFTNGCLEVVTLSRTLELSFTFEIKLPWMTWLEYSMFLSGKSRRSSRISSSG